MTQPTNNGGKPAVIGKVEILIYAGGGIEVFGFPPEYQKSLSIMSAAQRIVMDFFMEKAIKGEFQQQRILRPAPGTVVPT